MKLTAKLSVQGINELIRGVRQYKQNLRKQAQNIVSALMEEGIDICTAEIISLDIYDTGKLLQSLNGYTDLQTNKGVIKVDTDYAVFVEFGTGVPGNKAGYVGQAMSKTAYKYLGGTHYVTLPDGTLGWFYPGDDGKMHFTQGQASRPFMYNTAEKLKDLIRGIKVNA